MRSRAFVTGCRPPRSSPRPGSVTSMRPAASLRSTSARSSSRRRASMAALHALLRLVDPLAGRGPLGRRQRAERLQLLGERAFLAEPAHAHLIERGEVAARGNLVERLLS